MIKQPYAEAREIIVADAIREVVSELRLIDVADYIAFIRMERFSSIADLVDSAAELYFMPGALRLGHGGEAHSAWELPPKIALDLELHPGGAKVYFTLTLAAETASIEVNYVSFDNPSDDADLNTMRLKASLDAARIRASEPMRKAG
ncbi:hypothetical protein [Aliihoeflea sp. PC F10.4]